MAIHSSTTLSRSPAQTWHNIASSNEPRVSSRAPTVEQIDLYACKEGENNSKNHHIKQLIWQMKNVQGQYSKPLVNSLQLIGVETGVSFLLAGRDMRKSERQPRPLSNSARGRTSPQRQSNFRTRPPRSGGLHFYPPLHHPHCLHTWRNTSSGLSPRAERLAWRS